MDGLIPLLTLNLASVTTIMAILWLVSLRLRDVSIVDVAWGADGALIAIISFLLTDGPPARRLLITGMTVIWGLRLTLHIGLRKRGTGEDYRYAAMRAEHGDAFPLRSLFTVFLFQALLIWAITLPVQIAQAAGGPRGLLLLDFLGLGVWVLGFVLEGIADGQLQRFRSDPMNRGQVMDRGLWRYSRHPNYFGESLVWWGIFLVASSSPGGWITFFSPLLMTFFLLKVSGVPLLEDAMAERKAGYREYMERTSLFVPWPPGRGTGG